MHRGTPDGHITSEKPEHNRECRRALRHVLALELHRAPSFRDLEACIAPFQVRRRPKRASNLRRRSGRMATPRSCSSSVGTCPAASSARGRLSSSWRAAAGGPAARAP